MITLTPRQQTIADFVPLCACAADIGCDHGRLGAYLLQSGRVGKVIACDISRASLDKAERLAGQLGLANYVTRCGDGLSVVGAGEADCAVIAGMGGATIAGILSAAKHPPGVIVAQPMNAAYLLKESLAELGYMPADERLSLEGRRYYETLLLMRGNKSLTEAEKLLRMPAVRRRDPLCAGYIKHKLDILRAAALRANDASAINRKIAVFEEAEHWLRSET